MSIHMPMHMSVDFNGRRVLEDWVINEFLINDLTTATPLFQNEISVRALGIVQAVLANHIVHPSDQMQSESDARQ